MKRLVLACALAFLFHGGPVAADSDECTTLMKRFEEAPKQDVSASRLKRANESRDKGVALCAEGRGAGGVRALREALRLVGVKDVH